MTDSPLLSQAQIEVLLTQRSISDQRPWETGDPQAIDGYLKEACASVSRVTRAESRIEWDHYGSGYASFVDAWFYKSTPEFDVKQPTRYGEEHVGLVVLLSRLSPYFVFMEGEKRWHSHGRSGYLPAFEMLDELPSEGVRRLSQQVQPILENHGLIRAFRAELSAPLPSGVRVPTILSDRGFKHFDALFYWED